MAMKDLPIGSIFEYGHDTLVVEAQKDNQPSCTGCYFLEDRFIKRHGHKISCYVHGLACTKHTRKDGRHVVFKETVY